MTADDVSGVLARYDAACRALAAAHRVDEVKTIRDKAIAMQAYAKQAKDTTLITQATEIRMRAERRAGELLIEMAELGERDSGKGNRNPVLKSQAATPKLSDLGISKTQSSRWQELARISEDTPRSRAHQNAPMTALRIASSKKPRSRRPSGAIATSLSTVAGSTTGWLGRNQISDWR